MNSHGTEHFVWQLNMVTHPVQISVFLLCQDTEQRLYLLAWVFDWGISANTACKLFLLFYCCLFNQIIHFILQCKHLRYPLIRRSFGTDLIASSAKLIWAFMLNDRLGETKSLFYQIWDRLVEPGFSQSFVESYSLNYSSCYLITKYRQNFSAFLSPRLLMEFWMFTIVWLTPKTKIVPNPLIATSLLISHPWGQTLCRRLFNGRWIFLPCTRKWLPEIHQNDRFGREKKQENLTLSLTFFIIPTLYLRSMKNTPRRNLGIRSHTTKIHGNVVKNPSPMQNCLW